jgi:2-C-methyl-D-erythritol 4-phosphate cytidylyltransferase
LARFPKLETINLNWCEPTRGAIEDLSRVKKLKSLEMAGKPIYVPNLAILKKAPRLEKVIVTVAQPEESQARKILPNVRFVFRQNRSGVPTEVFAPLH